MGITILLGPDAFPLLRFPLLRDLIN